MMIPTVQMAINVAKSFGLIAFFSIMRDGRLSVVTAIIKLRIVPSNAPFAKSASAIGIVPKMSAYTYERFDVTFPDGTVTQYGRISRSNATWDTEFQVFTLTSDIEEDATRSESISLDYEFYHSHELALTCGNDYTVTITPKDIDIWIARLFLGDADGFSILYYQDVDSE